MGDDPRVMRSKAAILEATAELISEHGFPGVSIEAVAARSGAAKTTVYRHWPSREALVIEAFGLCAGPPAAPPDTGTLRGDLLEILSGLAASCARRAPAPPCSRSPTRRGATPSSPRLHAAFVAERQRPLVEVLERGVGRGELPAGLDVQNAVSVLVGPLFYRAMVSFEPLDDDFVRAVVDGALEVVAAPA